MRRRWMTLALGALGALPTAASAQSPLNIEPPDLQHLLPAVGGTSTIDLVTLRSDSPSAPLRFGGVIAGSEMVELEGRRLVRNTDYRIDNAAGVIYLNRPFRDGQTLLVQYRHDASQAKNGNGAMGLGAFRFSLMPGALNMVVGFGMTERTQDGNVLNTNLFGWNNSLQLGQGSLKGLYLVGERSKVQARSAFEYSQPGAATDLGKSSLMLQNLNTDFAGGKVSANYQSVSKNFTAFGAASDAGYDAAVVQRLQKEKGLKRLGFDAEGLKLGDLKLSSSFRTIADGEESLDWRSFGLGFGGFEASWSSRRLENGFTRFKDLAESDREQLAREVGMSRENYRLGYAGSGVKLGFDSSSILDAEKHGIARRSFSLESGKFSLKSGSLDVDRSFSRVGSLPDAEKNRLAREIGTRREWFEFAANFMPAGWQPLKFAENMLSSETGTFEGRDYSIGRGGWNFEHASRKIGRGFGAMGAMQDDERAGHVAAIAKMYQPGGLTYKPDEIARFLAGTGLERSVTRLLATPAKGWSLRAESLGLGGENGGGRVATIGLKGGGFQVQYRDQSLSDGFQGLGSLMEFERQQWGTVVGLDRTDLSTSFKFGKGGSFGFSQLSAEAPGGGIERRSLNYSDGRLAISANSREVDPGFADAGRLIDPERDLLNAIRGFKQLDIKAAWQLAPNLKLDAYLFDSRSDSLNQDRALADYKLKWAPSSRTSFGLIHLRAKDDDPLRLLFSNATDLMSFSHDMGRIGKLQYLQETRDFEGSNANLPDSHKRTVSYETKLSQKTSFRTEQTETRFDNGDKEDVSAHTVSTELGKRFGVSVSDVTVDRKGDERDERKRDMGFWIDFGRGLRLSYGLNRKETTPEQTTQNQQANLTPGTVGNLAIGESGYASQSVGDDTKTTGKVGLSMARPSRLGFLQIDELRYSTFTQSDRGRWLKEDKNFKIGGRIGTNGFSFEYRGQMHTDGNRAVDREYTFTTDQRETLPFRASAKYKVRTLPWAEPIMIRSYNFLARPTKNIELSHQLTTNPEVAKGDALLGSITQASQLNRWKLDFKQGPNLTIGGQWEEIMDQQRPRLRTAGVTAVFFAASGSPIHLFYGQEQADRDGKRYTTNRYSLRFDQRPGPNQVFSIFAGNVSYEHTIEDGKKRNNWTLQLNYQLRF